MFLVSNECRSGEKALKFLRCGNRRSILFPLVDVLHRLARVPAKCLKINSDSRSRTLAAFIEHDRVPEPHEVVHWRRGSFVLFPHTRYLSGPHCLARSCMSILAGAISTGIRKRLTNNLALGYYGGMAKVNEAARELAKLSVAARRAKWGNEGFRKRMQAWGKLGGRPSGKKGSRDAN